jgi:hypothetical protein
MQTHHRGDEGHWHLEIVDEDGNADDHPPVLNSIFDGLVVLPSLEYGRR